MMGTDIDTGCPKPANVLDAKVEEASELASEASEADDVAAQKEKFAQQLQNKKVKELQARQKKIDPESVC
jgi:hypothetical protein